MSSIDELVRIKGERAKKELGIPEASVYYSRIRRIAVKICRIAKQDLGFEYDIDELIQTIEQSRLPAFVVCPASSVKHPLVFITSPISKNNIDFLDYIIAHEIGHLKLALFIENKLPYFIFDEEFVYWQKAGYSVYSIEDFFGNTVDRLGKKNAYAIVSAYAERLRDFYVNLRLLESEHYSAITEKWEREELSSNSDEQILRYENIAGPFPDYRSRLLALDIGAKTALLRRKLDDKDAFRGPVFGSFFQEGNTIVFKVDKLFRELKYLSDPYLFSSQVRMMDNIVGLSRSIAQDSVR
jgi:hypothetical protein